MARQKSAGISPNPVHFGMSNKVMKRKKPVNLDFIKKIEPLTDNQQELFDKYKQNQNIVGSLRRRLQRRRRSGSACVA